MHADSYNFDFVAALIRDVKYYSIACVSNPIREVMVGASYDMLGGGLSAAKVSRRPASCFPTPKRGKRRMYNNGMKVTKVRLHTAKWRKLYKTTPYVRHHSETACCRFVPPRTATAARQRCIRPT